MYDYSLFFTSIKIMIDCQRYKAILLTLMALDQTIIWNKDSATK